MEKCDICEIAINKSKDKFYKQEKIENENIIPVILCEDCMAELHKCSQCGIARPYCNDCI